MNQKIQPTDIKFEGPPPSPESELMNSRDTIFLTMFDAHEAAIAMEWRKKNWPESQAMMVNHLLVHALQPGMKIVVLMRRSDERSDVFATHIDPASGKRMQLRRPYAELANEITPSEPVEVSLLASEAAPLARGFEQFQRFNMRIVDHSKLQTALNVPASPAGVWYGSDREPGIIRLQWIVS